MENKVKRGFFTIAFGKHYQKIAYNLLLTARYNKLKYPFAIISNSSNKYTKAFDLEIIKDPIEKGYFNKLCIDLYAPFEESIFIDADSLIFMDISFFFDLVFQKNNENAVFGNNKYLDKISSTSNLYFDPTRVKGYDIEYVPAFDSGIYCYKASGKTKDVFKIARELKNKNINYGFRIVNGDESYVALAMAICKCKCNTLHPILKWDFLNKDDKLDIINHILVSKESKYTKYISHVSTIQTYGAFYKNLVGKFKYRNSPIIIFYKLNLTTLLFKFRSFFRKFLTHD